MPRPFGKSSRKLRHVLKLNAKKGRECVFYINLNKDFYVHMLKYVL